MKLCRLEYCKNYVVDKKNKKCICGLNENYVVDDMTQCYEDAIEDIEDYKDFIILYVEAKKENENCTLALKCPYRMNPIGCESRSGDSVCGGFMGTKEIDDILFVKCAGV